MLIDGYRVILFHYPIADFDCMYHKSIHLYGHVHISLMFQTWGKQSACLCVERHNYYPVNEEVIIEQFRKGN